MSFLLRSGNIYVVGKQYLWGIDVEAHASFTSPGGKHNNMNTNEYACTRSFGCSATKRRWEASLTEHSALDVAQIFVFEVRYIVVIDCELLLCHINTWYELSLPTRTHYHATWCNNTWYHRSSAAVLRLVWFWVIFLSIYVTTISLRGRNLRRTLSESKSI